MRVSKTQIVQGVSDYVKSNILPQLGGARSMQIIVSIGANVLAANHKLVDAMLGNQIVSALLDDDGSGTYDISGLADAMRKAIETYGALPVQIPPIPLIAPREITLRLDASDVDAMRSLIEGTVA